MAKKKTIKNVKTVNSVNLPSVERSITRFKNVVTMFEVTDGNNIKAYELEPEYKELVSGGSSGINYNIVFGPIADEIQPTDGFYVIDNYDADVFENNNLFILEINLNDPIILYKTSSPDGFTLHDLENKNAIYFDEGKCAIKLDPAYGPYDYPSSYIFLYAAYFQEEID